MKKGILLLILMSVHLGLSAQVIHTLSIHNSCVTALKVCVKARITTPNTPVQAECKDSLVAQYFKFQMTDSGNIALNTFGHTGSYTLYGPMQATGLSSCQQIAIGQISQVSGSLAGAISIPHQEGYYVLKVTPTNCIGIGDDYKVDIDIQAPLSGCGELETTCKDCISSFSPEPGKYLISAWVKGEAANRNSSYQNPGIRVSFVGVPGNLDFSPSGLIIDDWQRIDGVVSIPASATSITISLTCSDGDCLFDDIRFIPINGSMISYVYDPISMKLVAQLDERNYATLYEYDEEGRLIRTKQETERGIMTVQENRENLHKK